MFCNKEQSIVYITYNHTTIGLYVYEIQGCDLIMPRNVQNKPNQTMFALSFRNARISSDRFMRFLRPVVTCSEHATRGKYAFDERL